MKIITIILLTIFKLDGMISFSVHSGGLSKVVIDGFRWPEDSVSTWNIPNEEILVFNNAKVGILPSYFANQFRKCIRLDFRYGKITTIHINPKLTHIELRFSSTENVSISQGTHYQLENFLCIGTKLIRIPENINQLKNIRKIDLSNNLIETVQLDQLDGLGNLERLYLSFNKIKRIASDGLVSFPLLTGIHLAHNKLQHLDVCIWEMPLLNNLNLNYNRLTHFAVNNFPLLHSLNMEKNPLNCAWKASLLKHKSDLGTLEKLTCDEKSVGVFGVDCPSRQQYSQVERSKIQKLEAQLENLTSKLIAQENVSNDIIEAMYRTDIERAPRIKSNQWVWS